MSLGGAGDDEIASLQIIWRDSLDDILRAFLTPSRGPPTGSEGEPSANIQSHIFLESHQDGIDCDPYMSWSDHPNATNLIFVLVAILVPIIPAFIFFKWLPADSNVGGTWQGLKIKLTGAFGGYFAIFATIIAVTKPKIDLLYSERSPRQIRITVVV